MLRGRVFVKANVPRRRERENKKRTWVPRRRRRRCRPTRSRPSTPLSLSIHPPSSFPYAAALAAAGIWAWVTEESHASLVAGAVSSGILGLAGLFSLRAYDQVRRRGGKKKKKKKLSLF